MSSDLAAAAEVIWHEKKKLSDEAEEADKNSRLLSGLLEEADRTAKKIGELTSTCVVKGFTRDLAYAKNTAKETCTRLWKAKVAFTNSFLGFDKALVGMKRTRENLDAADAKKAATKTWVEAAKKELKDAEKFDGMADQDLADATTNEKAAYTILQDLVDQES
jgi:hypothetical protein